MGVTVQEEHDGLEEGRSDPEGRGAHGPARPTRGRAGKKSTNELVQDVFLPARETVSDGRRKQGRRSILHVKLGDGENVAHDADGPFACEKG